MSEFPKLMWAPDGREFTVQDQKEQDERVAEGFRLAIDPVDAHSPTPNPKRDVPTSNTAEMKPHAVPASGPMPNQAPSPLPHDDVKAAEDDKHDFHRKSKK